MHIMHHHPSYLDLLIQTPMTQKRTILIPPLKLAILILHEHMSAVELELIFLKSVADLKLIAKLNHMKVCPFELLALKVNLMLKLTAVHILKFLKVLNAVYLR